jgi:hypothetical protein
MCRVHGDNEKNGQVEKNGVRNNLKASAAAPARRAAISCRKLCLTPLFGFPEVPN